MIACKNTKEVNVKPSISELLNNIKIEKISGLKIDNENNKVSISLLDYSKNEHQLELLGVQNYHFIDDYIYVKENEKNNVKGVSFYDSSPWGYKAITFDKNGNKIDEEEIEPNLLVNSKEKSICLSISGAKLDGDFYPVFRNSFLSGAGKNLEKKITEC